MTSVRVDLGPRSYEVRIAAPATGGPDAFARFAREALEATGAGRGCRSALVVTDPNVEALAGPYAEALGRAGIAPSVAVVPAGEGSKSLGAAAGLYDRLVAGRADRHSAVVAIGGGVVGDLAGFVAATYARGIPLLMIPTTLLAQVDSSVGGKVGVNHPGAKNIIGAFHQPSGVWIDPATLATLPPRELRCGLAEVVKYGVILDAPFFDWLEGHVDAILARDPPTIARVIARCCELKAGVVERDEREETGLRAVLNFGHTDRPRDRGGRRLRRAVSPRRGGGRGDGRWNRPGRAAGPGRARRHRADPVAPGAVRPADGRPRARPRRPDPGDGPGQEEPGRRDPLRPARRDRPGRAGRGRPRPRFAPPCSDRRRR